MDYICSSCGAPVVVKNRFSKIAVCGYCGTHHRISVEGLDPSGKHPKLAEFPSLLSIGSRGRILEKPFIVSGRIRYSYSGGFFDEWFLEYDGEPAWLTEDEGYFTLYTDLIESAELPESIDDVRAGQNLSIGDRKVMIKEKGIAKIEGGEGELYFEVQPGTSITYIDAISDGKRISIEFGGDEVELFTGRPVMKRDVVVEE